MLTCICLCVKPYVLHTHLSKHTYADTPVQKCLCTRHALPHADKTRYVVPHDNVCMLAYFQAEQQQKQAAAAKERNWLMSQQTLDKSVVQRLDFTKNLRAQRHLFLEVRILFSL